MNVEITKLPATVQRALKGAGYHKRDIKVEPKETFRMEQAWSAGCRGMTVAINMSTGETKTLLGSWGGANPFEKRQVDHDETDHPIPVNGAAFVGQTGHKVSGTLYVRPDAIAALLPPPADVTDKERSILAIFGGLKSFARPEELRRIGATSQEVDSLVSRGFLARSASGATSITTAGKNARGNAQVF